MARILITSGPTRQYLDPVRYLSNASSGQMGKCLAAAAIAQGHDVIIVSGPVSVGYPEQAEVVPVMSTQEMLDEALKRFPNCDGVIGAAAPCDFQPAKVAPQKIKKSEDTFRLELEETPDIMKALGELKQSTQWSVAFALETENGKENALNKLTKKNCDLVVLNSPAAIESLQTQIKVLDSTGTILAEVSDTKLAAANEILRCIERHLIDG